MKKRGAFLLIFVILTMLLVTGCEAANKSSGLSNSSAMSGEVADRGAAIADSGHSQANEVTAGQAGAHSTQNIPDVAKSTQDKTSSQTAAANSAPPANSLSPSATSSVDQASASAQPSSTVASVSRQPAAAQPTDPAKPTVTIAINCQTMVDKGLAKQEKFQGVVPADGVILPVTRVEITDGETVFSVLQRATREHKIQLVYKGSQGTPYIQGINNLYEFDSGPLSGWMYCVNKLYAHYGCNETKLKNGDTIEWNYTCDMGKDLGRQ